MQRRNDSQNTQVPRNTIVAWNRQASVDRSPRRTTPATRREVQCGPAMRAPSTSPPRLFLQGQTMRERSPVIRSPCKVGARPVEHPARHGDYAASFQASPPHDGVTGAALSTMARAAATSDMRASGRQLQAHLDLRPSSVHQSRPAPLKPDTMSWQPPARYPGSPQGPLLLESFRWTSSVHPGDGELKRMSSPARVVHPEVRCSRLR